jgi:hypothetical protein
MSTENETIEDPQPPETTAETTPGEEVKTAETTPDTEAEEKAEEAVETLERESLTWPGVQGEGVMQLRFFDIEGLPGTLEDETDPQLRILLALVAELQQVRSENMDLKAAVQYMSLESFIAQKGAPGGPRHRPAPGAMYRLANGQ